MIPAYYHIGSFSRQSRFLSAHAYTVVRINSRKKVNFLIISLFRLYNYSPKITSLFPIYVLEPEQLSSPCPVRSFRPAWQLSTVVPHFLSTFGFHSAAVAGCSAVGLSYLVPAGLYSVVVRLFLILLLILFLILILLLLLVFQLLLSKCQIISGFIIFRIIPQSLFICFDTLRQLLRRLQNHSHIMINLSQFSLVFLYAMLLQTVP